jgi:hypothetical protein
MYQTMEREREVILVKSQRGARPWCRGRVAVPVRGMPAHHVTDMIRSMSLWYRLYLHSSTMQSSER